MKYNTLDVDTNDIDKIEHMMHKISQCKQLFRITHKPSSSKGIHVKMWCKAECDMCRLLFDDQRRYEMDTHRPIWAQNILFADKEPLRV